MEEMLIYILEKYAEKTEKQTQRNGDLQKKAYMSGKADGLRLAKDLIYMLSENINANESKLAEAI
jgi:hypothetical protein